MFGEHSFPVWLKKEDIWSQGHMVKDKPERLLPDWEGRKHCSEEFGIYDKGSGGPTKDSEQEMIYRFVF